MKNAGLYSKIKMSLRTADLLVLATLILLVFTFVFAVETAENVVVGEVTTEDCSSVQYIFHVHSLNSHSAAFIKLNG